MPKPYKAQIVSGNLLHSGQIVYRMPDGTYDGDFRQAAIAEDAETLERWLLEANEALLVSAYGIVIALRNNVPEPVHFRERIRILGPTFNNSHNLDQQWQDASKDGFTQLITAQEEEFHV